MVLREWRLRRGWTRRDVAQAAGVGYATAANAELGIPATLPGGIMRLVEALDGPEVAECMAVAYIEDRRSLGRALLAAGGG